MSEIKAWSPCGPAASEFRFEDNRVLRKETRQCSLRGKGQVRIPGVVVSTEVTEGLMTKSVKGQGAPECLIRSTEGFRRLIVVAPCSADKYIGGKGVG